MPTNLRRVLLSICLAVFSFSLITLPWSHLATVTILNRDVVKGWLEKSDAYDKMASFMAESTKMEVAVGAGDTPTQDPRINQIFQDAIAPTFSRQNADHTVDGVYDWLSGKSDTLTLTSDLQSIKQRLADEMSKYAAEKANSLPVCTPEQSAQLASTPTDLWSTPCLPAGTSSAQIQADVKNQILVSKDFLNTGAQSTDSIGNPDSKIQKNLAGLQTSYQLALLGPIIFGTTAVLSAVAAIFLSATRLKGLRRLGVTAATSGAITLISALSIHFGLTAIANTQNAFLGSIAVVVEGDVTRVLMSWGIGLLVAGAAVIAASWYLGQQNQPAKMTPAKK